MVEVISLCQALACSPACTNPAIWPFDLSLGKFLAVSPSLVTARSPGRSWGLLLVLLAFGACKAPVKPKGPRDKPPKDNLPLLLEGFDFVESFRGAPAAIGCSDGQREGFADLSRFPNIAGCVGAWQGRKKLTADGTGKSCGDDGEACASPADLCAPGWHLCSKDGNTADIKDRVSAQQCEKEAGPGRFVAAMSHGQVARICPPPPGPHTRFPCMERGICAEPVCCGDACTFGACKDAVWTGKTRISRASPNGCGSALSRFHGGVLCCRDHKVARIAAADVQGDLKLGVPPKLPAEPASKTPTAPAKGAALDKADQKPKAGEPAKSAAPDNAAEKASAKPVAAPKGSTPRPNHGPK